MAFELKPGQGSLFKNDRKQKDTHPDLNGSININGVEHWLSAWTKRNDDGSFKLLSISVGDPKQKQSGGGQARGADPRSGPMPSDSGAHTSDLDDEIPF